MSNYQDTDFDNIYYLEVLGAVELEEEVALIRILFETLIFFYISLFPSDNQNLMNEV